MSVAAVAFMAANGRFRGIVVDDGGSISSDNGTFLTDGAGNITATSITGLSGAVTTSGAVQGATVTGTSTVLGGKLQVNATTSAQSIATGNTITLTANRGALLLTTAGAATGVIMSTPTTSSGVDQEVWLINTSANSITFAAAGTSHVADGTSDVIAANSAAKMIWDFTQSLWYRA